MVGRFVSFVVIAYTSITAPRRLSKARKKKIHILTRVKKKTGLKTAPIDFMVGSAMV